MKKNIRDTVREVIEPTVTSLGYSIWDVTYSKIGADYHLEITIDHERGINIEDCEKVHRTIDPLLDELDPIEGAYHLEVSSPGIERDIRTDEHFAVCMGEKVEVRLFAPLEGRKSFVGILAAYEDGIITIDENGVEYKIPRDKASAIKTVFDFS